MAPNQGSEDRGEEDQDRSDKTHRARTRAREEAPVQRVSDAIRELREDFEVVAIWTREDGDEVHALAEFVRPDDVTRTRVEVNIARRPSWALARMILRRVAADRRDGRDPWRARPKPPPARSRAQADPYEHLYRRD